ncbi:hypothetical protein BGZ76_002293, partial [Entomortierella beljakovae]
MLTLPPFPVHPHHPFGSDTNSADQYPIPSQQQQQQHLTRHNSLPNPGQTSEHFQLVQQQLLYGSNSLFREHQRQQQAQQQSHQVLQTHLPYLTEISQSHHSVVHTSPMSSISNMEKLTPSTGTMTMPLSRDFSSSERQPHYQQRLRSSSPMSWTKSEDQSDTIVVSTAPAATTTTSLQASET